MFDHERGAMPRTARVLNVMHQSVCVYDSHEEINRASLASFLLRDKSSIHFKFTRNMNQKKLLAHLSFQFIQPFCSINSVEIYKEKKDKSRYCKRKNYNRQSDTVYPHYVFLIDTEICRFQNCCFYYRATHSPFANITNFIV